MGFFCPRLDQRRAAAAGAARALRQDIREEKTIKASKDFILREIAGEYILVPAGAASAKLNGLITLNELGWFIFKTLQQEQSLAGLTDAITEEYDVARAEAKADALAFLQQLDGIGALEGAIE